MKRRNCDEHTETEVETTFRAVQHANCDGDDSYSNSADIQVVDWNRESEDNPMIALRDLPTLRQIIAESIGLNECPHTAEEARE